MRNVTLFTLTRTVCSDCILMIRIAVRPYVVALCVMAATTGTPRCSEVKPDEMKYIPIMIYGDEALVDKTVSGRDKIPYSSASRKAIMNSAANLTISSQRHTIMAFFSYGVSIRLIYTGLQSSSDYITNIQ